MAGFMLSAMDCCGISTCVLPMRQNWQIVSSRRCPECAGEPTAEADRARHPGFLRFNVLAGGPGSLVLVVRPHYRFPLQFKEYKYANLNSSTVLRRRFRRGRRFRHPGG